MTLTSELVSGWVKPTTQPQPFYSPFSGTTQGEPVPEENFWTLWCKGKLTEADTPTIRLGATPSAKPFSVSYKPQNHRQSHMM